MNLDELKELRDKELPPLSFGTSGHSLGRPEDRQQTIVGAISGAGNRHIIIRRSEAVNENAPFTKRAPVDGDTTGFPFQLINIGGGYVRVRYGVVNDGKSSKAASSTVIVSMIWKARNSL